jgi:hypothetical protein
VWPKAPDEVLRPFYFLQKWNPMVAVMARGET